MFRSSRGPRPASAHLCLLLAAAAVLVASASAGAADTSDDLPPPKPPVRRCEEPGTGWCLARRFPGEYALGELGFRFGEPLDMDGDGKADVAAGARFRTQGVYQSGIATVWSGANGAKLREWEGAGDNGLFGHWVLPVPDLDGDGLADVVISAPNSAPDGKLRGIVTARSPKSGNTIWTRTAEREENLGWHLDLAGDQDGDGVEDIFAGAPTGHDAGRVYLLSGKDGSVLRTYKPDDHRSSFGWYVARIDDLDGDGKAELLVGAFQGEDPPGDPKGAIYLFSGASGTLLRQWIAPDSVRGFGEIVTPVGDLDGDGRPDVAVSSPRTSDNTRSKPGEVQVFSTRDGSEIRHWTGIQPGALYGRMVVDAGDIDGDGTHDVAISAPWFRYLDPTIKDPEGIPTDRTGRVEIRSGKTGDVLAEWFGDQADCWFGFHIRRAPDPDGKGRPALLISSIRCPVDKKKAVGLLDLLVLQGAAPTGSSPAAPAASTSGKP
jgi:hypothetical protein